MNILSEDRSEKMFLIVIFTIIGLILLILVGAFITHEPLVRTATPTPTDFERRDRIVQECMASEEYTREECITLAGQP